MKSKKRINRARSKDSTNRKEYKCYAHHWSDIEWDYGWNAMVRSKHRSGFKPPKKLIWKSQWRAWRSWKHNRKTQWKNK